MSTLSHRICPGRLTDTLSRILSFHHLHNRALVEVNYYCLTIIWKSFEAIEFMRYIHPSVQFDTRYPKYYLAYNGIQGKAREAMACLDWKARTILSPRLDRQKTDSETLVRVQTYPMVSSHVRCMDLILCLDLGTGQQAGYGAGQRLLGVGGELMALSRAVAIKVNPGNIQSAEYSRLLTAFKMISLALQLI